MSVLSIDRALSRRERERIARGLVFPVVCRRCHIITGTSPEKDRPGLCHACNWALMFEEHDPRNANKAQNKTEAAEVLTEGASILSASSNSLPGDVQSPSVSASGFETDNEF
jgi:hypothetical protein